MAYLSLIRPANDAAALELSNWCTRLNCPPQHVVAHDLYAGAATRNAVPAAMQGVQAMLFFGHGGDSELVGGSGALVDAANVGLAKGAIIVAVACSSAKVLGPISIRLGVAAYLGFRERFVWLSRDPDHRFERAIHRCLGALLSGGEMKDVLQQMRDGLQEVVEYYLYGSGSASPNQAVGWLAAFWDMQHLDLHGDGAAKL